VKVCIRFLGVYREYLPANASGSTYSLETPSGTRIEELQAKLPIPAEQGQVILINGRTPLSGQVLKEGDTVAVFPAMAGG
jgi:molybdopterin converting factor small subunit